MKKYFMIFAAALIAFAACQEEMTPEINTNEGGILDYPIEMTFTADNETAAKTAISGTEVMWESDDEIKVLWSNTGNNKAIAEPYNENTCAQFTTKVEEAEAYYAVHPYAATSSYVDGNIVVKVPAIQGGYGPGSFTTGGDSWTNKYELIDSRIYGITVKEKE